MFVILSKKFTYGIEFGEQSQFIPQGCYLSELV